MKLIKDDGSEVNLEDVKYLIIDEKRKVVVTVKSEEIHKLVGTMEQLEELFGSGNWLITTFGVSTISAEDKDGQ